MFVSYFERFSFVLICLTCSLVVVVVFSFLLRSFCFMYFDEMLLLRDMHDEHERAHTHTHRHTLLLLTYTHRHADVFKC